MTLHDRVNQLEAARRESMECRSPDNLDALRARIAHRLNQIAACSLERAEMSVRLISGHLSGPAARLIQATLADGNCARHD